MRRLSTLLLAVVAAACAPAAPPRQAARVTELSGRMPGAPQRCIAIETGEGLRIGPDGHSLLYGRGRIVWVNRLGTCGFRPGDTLVSEPIGSDYCRGDLVRSFDSVAKLPGETCELGEFVPYTR